MNSWNNLTDCCRWDGVTCDSRSGYVIGLYISCSDLRGELLGPNSSIFSLRHLQQLILDSNDFSGSSIHSTIGDLVNLRHLHLLNSGMTGDVPCTISHLSKLEYLLIGSIDSLNDPIKRYSRMRLDDYTWNRLIHNATNLREICLFGMDMSFIRESSLLLLTNLSSSLVSLVLLDTQIQGKLPTNILKLPNLQEIYLSWNKNLRGELPKSNWTTPLRILSLSRTAFSGYISDSIGQLKSLNLLELRDCNFDGFIPPSLFNLTQLSFLDLSYNKLVGPIPTQITKLQGHIPIPPNGLEIFLVSNNELSGDISLAMCNASTLSILNLAHNNLTGLVPQCWGTFPSLWALDLQDNNLYGSIPDNFSNGNAFKTLKLNGNQLKGPLPRALAHCTKLEVLDVGNNNIEDTFPYWLETLPNLQVLSLRSNKFHGVIASFGIKPPFPSLKIFDISDNYFTGPLPVSYIHNFQGMKDANDNQNGLKYLGDNSSYNDSIVIVMKGLYMELTRILTVFTSIDLSNNMFEGEVPKVIGELHSLIGLNISHNRITGTIPLSLGNLNNLEWLDLSWNQLKGEIPMSLTNLNFLAVLNLSQNQFEGVIPTGRQFNTFGNNSYVGNPMLCGFPLSKSCNEDKERPPCSTLDKEESGFGWKVIVVGYACGMIFGIILGCNVFFVGKLEWLARLVEVVLNVRLIRTNIANHANGWRRN
ncbi:hypothetical protein LR48_Vigan07g044500 [Vigna angularis]|nr:hypothetical protein LR48_Vigan07g044500 [Vigna angularis]